jgi:hypothetical protein
VGKAATEINSAAAFFSVNSRGFYDTIKAIKL